ncbi:MAG: sugar phosphate isomerase/epimerase [Desulfatitalea sp.]|nr:TIM barrel protein [Desulfatitalea sp.]NNK02546.1 sugar phosphate isomerase/epimerase [Desulfatitalea sp.]
MFPKLSKSYKGRYPFRLSVPSFIYPAGYAANVRELAPFVDEIELLLFESAPHCLPTLEEIDQLANLSRQHGLTYNVHLPIDLFPGSQDPRQRRHAVNRLSHIIDFVRPLAPVTHTLHLPSAGYPHDAPAEQAWQHRCMQCLTELFAAVDLAPQQMSLETLDYPPQWLEPVVTHFDMAVCVDVGHLLHHCHALNQTLDRYGHRIEIVHLHAVAGNKDHRPLTHLDPPTIRCLQKFLSTFTGSVSIEVFSFEYLALSLVHLDRVMAPSGTVAPNTEAC